MKSLSIVNFCPFPAMLVALVASGFAGPWSAVSNADDEPMSASDFTTKTMSIPGVFESRQMVNISAENEQFKTLVLERILPHGSSVKKGQAVVWLDAEPLDQKLKAAELEFQLAELALENAVFDHEQLLANQKLDKAEADRARDNAQQDFDNYQKTDREGRIKQAEFSLKSSEFRLDSASEEFNQLKKMYEEDDLTEESEEIVLRRAKQAMEAAQFSLEQSIIATERNLKQSIPRTDASEESKLARAVLDHQKTTHSQRYERVKSETELERKQLEFHEREVTLDQMRAERKRVTLKAPHDGIWILGELNRGKLPAKPVQYKPGQSVTGKQVLGVVVNPAKLLVRVDLAEEHVGEVQDAKSCVIVPNGFKSRELDGTIQSISKVPFTNGKLDCIVKITSTSLDGLVPTMGCELKFVVPSNDRADSASDEDKPTEDKPTEDKPTEDKEIQDEEIQDEEIQDEEIQDEASE